MTVETKEKLVVKRIFDAPRSRVFKALTDPEEMGRWFYGMDVGKAEVVNELRVGGGYEIHMTNDEGADYRPHGKYLEVSPPEKLVFTWSSECFVEESVVSIVLHDRGEKTELVLTHELHEEALKDHGEGWTACFDHLDGFFAELRG